ncbi:MAG: hypothetical protein JSS56_27820 [Proteobacteria bacterium]|nr:hypothetical protein [Pseudomonadota bacterium]
MALFRKKPVVIEARQFDGTLPCAEKLLPWIGDRASWAGESADCGTLIIATLEGTHAASPGDWIICGVKGEFYPCKPDIFAQTYEAAD